MSEAMQQAFDRLAAIADWHDKMEEYIELQEAKLIVGKLEGALSEADAKEIEEKIKKSRAGLNKVYTPWDGFPI